MMATAARLALRLIGPFGLFMPNGQRIEISSKKGTAVLAMLAMSRDGERTRGWLQERLWGSRGHAEAAGSLRRELSNLRKILKAAHPDLLVSDRDRVRLKLDLLDIDALDPQAPSAPASEFLEGIDIIGEPGFREWLRDQRSTPERNTASIAAGPSGASLPSHVVDISKPPAGFDGKPAIAVLPFTNVTSDEALDYLAEGISEDLVVGLSRIRWLPVISHRTSFAVDENVDRKTVGQRLGAQYLVDGRLYRVQQSYGVSASLSDASTGYSLWTRRFTLQSADAHQQLEQFVTELVAQLETRIEHAEQSRSRAKRHDKLGVSDLIWRGRWHLNRLSRADADMAQKLFADALALDPGSPEALIQMTSALGWSIWARQQPRHQVLRMRDLAHRATLADPEDGRGFMLAGIAEMWLRHPPEAKNLLQQAIALNPSLALAHAQLGGCFNLAGEPEQALVHLETALRLSSNDPNVFYSLGELAMAFTLLGRWPQAIEHARLALARRPSYWYAHVIKINALARSGQLAAASLARDELMSAKPNFSRGYIDWLPFYDRAWIDHLVEGLNMAPGSPPEQDGAKAPAKIVRS